MPPPYSKQIALNTVLPGLAQSQASIRDNIEGIWGLVFASRRIIAEAREALARANEVLARVRPPASADRLNLVPGVKR